MYKQYVWFLHFQFCIIRGLLTLTEPQKPVCFWINWIQGGVILKRHHGMYNKNLEAWVHLVWIKTATYISTASRFISIKIYAMFRILGRSNILVQIIISWWAGGCATHCKPFSIILGLRVIQCLKWKVEWCYFVNSFTLNLWTPTLLQLSAIQLLYIPSLTAIRIVVKEIE